MIDSILAIAVNRYPLVMVPWNVFLALIPCFLAWKMGGMFKSKWSALDLKDRLGFILIFLFWLFFLPNTVYLITMVRHLLDHCSDYDPLIRVCREEAWMEAFFFLYALIGVPTFIYALKKMSNLVGRLFNRLTATFFPIILIPITTLGLFFGLFDRLNSWDVVAHPIAIIRIGLGYFADFRLVWNFMFYTATLYLIYYLVPPFFRKIYD